MKTNLTTPPQPDPRSIDALVDKHIFGREQEYHVMKLGLYYRPPANGYTDNRREAARYSKEEAEKHVRGCGWEVTMVPCEPEHYSTQIAAAMEVVDKLGVEEFGFTKLRNGSWECALMVLEDLGFAQYRATAPTREMALCLAALRANGITI